MVDLSWLSTPVGLVVRPTRLPSNTLNPSSRSTSIPVLMFAPFTLVVKSSSSATIIVGLNRIIVV